MTLKRVTADVRPIHKLAKGFKSCPQEAAAYGKCITARYLEVEPKMCANEFAAFKSCVQTAVRVIGMSALRTQMGRKW